MRGTGEMAISSRARNDAGRRPPAARTALGIPRARWGSRRWGCGLVALRRASSGLTSKGGASESAQYRAFLTVPTTPGRVTSVGECVGVCGRPAYVCWTWRCVVVTRRDGGCGSTRAAVRAAHQRDATNTGARRMTDAARVATS